MHGTLEMTHIAVKFNFQPVLLKTLIPTMNTLKDMAIRTLTIDRKIFEFKQIPVFLKNWCVCQNDNTQMDEKRLNLFKL